MHGVTGCEHSFETMHLWRKLAEPRWVRAYQNILQASSGGNPVIISRPGWKRQQLEIACTSPDYSRKLIDEFGGPAERWARDKGGTPYSHPSFCSLRDGKHATTAMSLRFLERLTRKWKTGWSLVDLGTGSGILALGGEMLWRGTRDWH